jgi:hypothetical protein
VRIEQPPVAVTLDEARRVQLAESNASVESAEQRRTVKDLVQEAIHKRHFFS